MFPYIYVIYRFLHQPFNDVVNDLQTQIQTVDNDTPKLDKEIEYLTNEVADIEKQMDELIGAHSKAL